MLSKQNKNRKIVCHFKLSSSKYHDELCNKQTLILNMYSNRLAEAYVCSSHMTR